MSTILQPAVLFRGNDVEGKSIDRITRRLADITDIFADKAALAGMDQDQKVYDVASYLPVADGTEAGLFFGITYIYPGKVGNEYFMTKGHFHQLRNRAEFYHCLEGEGMLILMDEQRHTWAEKMYPGSLHYIPGNTAHRTANTGNKILVFSAFWPSDAGHDYAVISQQGFSRILVEDNGQPVLVDRP